MEEIMEVRTPELRDTVDGMLSSDYRERARAELIQLEVRHGKLARMLAEWDAGRLDFEPTTPRDILEAQLDAMGAYHGILTYRAKLEGIL